MTLVFGLFWIGTLLREICIFASGCVTVTTLINTRPDDRCRLFQVRIGQPIQRGMLVQR